MYFVSDSNIMGKKIKNKKKKFLRLGIHAARQREIYCV
jgi:hypothetical protein